MGGGGHPDPEMGVGVGGLQTNFFQFFDTSVRPPPLDPPLGTARREFLLPLRLIVNQSGKIDIPTIPEESSMKPYLLPCW